MTERDHKVGRLLGDEDILSVLEQEAVFERVMKDLAMEQTPWYQRFWKPATALATTAAALLLVLVLQSPRNQYTPRGDSARVAVDIICQPGPMCRHQDRILFRVSGGAETGFLSAFAQRPDGNIIWYFPQSAAEKSEPYRREAWLSRSIQIGPEHVAGEYRLQLFVSDKPLERAMLRRYAETGSAPEDVVRIERKLVIEP